MSPITIEDLKAADPKTFAKHVIKYNEEHPEGDEGLIRYTDDIEALCRDYLCRRERAWNARSLISAARGTPWKHHRKIEMFLSEAHGLLVGITPWKESQG